MSQFEFSQSSVISNLTEQSSGEKPTKVFLFNKNNFEIIENGKVVSGEIHDGQFVKSELSSEFASSVNAVILMLNEKISEIIDDENNEDEEASTMSTGFLIDANEESDKTIQIASVVEQYKSGIETFEEVVLDLPDSDESFGTQKSASTKSALSVLSVLKSEETITKIITPIIFSKKKLAPELVDITFTKCFYKASSVEEMLAKNNQFGILKFACANDIPINGRLEKLFYFVKELEWMLEQGESNKNTTRKLRYDVLSECTKNPLALKLFDIIYKMLCREGEFIKICAVGGNVLRAFFLALRWARNDSAGVANTETCAAFNPQYGWTKEEIVELGEFATRFDVVLNTLCEKSSDTDFTVIKKMTSAEKTLYGELIQRALDAMCADKDVRSQCNNEVEFPLIRMKTPVFEDGQYYFEKCKGYIENIQYIMNSANKYFSEIMWFAQGIPDYSVEQLDILYATKLADIENLDVTPETKDEIRSKFKKIYPEIRKLFCNLQHVKIHNAALTSFNSDIISSYGSFNSLMRFTTTCCEIFSEVINPEVTEDHELQDIIEIVTVITPPASQAMFNILKNGTTAETINNVLQQIKNAEKLASKTFYATYKTNIFVLGDDTNPVKSTSIAVGSKVEGVSDIHKSCSATIRDSFKQDETLNPVFLNNIVISINCLKFGRASSSIEDLKDYEAPSEERPSEKSLPIFSVFKSSTAPRKIKTSITATPSAGGGGSASQLWTVESLGTLTHTALYNKCALNNTIGHSQYRKKTPLNTNFLIKMLLDKQKEQGMISGGAKTRKRKPRKTRKRGKRGMRKTRKGAIV